MLPKIEFGVASYGNNPETYKVIKEFIAKWQRILKIQEWEITLEFLTAYETAQEMGSSEYSAFCVRTINLKEAKICINCEMIQDEKLEITLIHELLHIVFDDYDNFTEDLAKDDYVKKIIRLKKEQTIESLAKSFASLIEEGADNENH